MQPIGAAAMTILAMILQGGADPAQQRCWADRLQQDVETVLADETVEAHERRHIVMLAAMALARAGRAADAIAVSRQVLGENWSGAAMMIAAEQSAVDDLEGALKTARLPRGDVQQQALVFVAIRQAQRGDHSDAMQLVEQIDESFRDRALKRIAEAMIKDGKIQMAVKAQRMVGDAQTKEDIRQFYRWHRDRPDPADPDFEERSVTEARETWGSLGFSAEDARLVRFVSRAKVALHKKDNAAFKRAMRQAVDLTDDPGAQFALAALYDAGGERETALQLLRAVLKAYIETEGEFNLFRILSSEGLSNLLARCMPMDELHQWGAKLIEAGSNDLVAGIAAGLATQGKFADADRMYQMLSEPSHRAELAAYVLMADVDWK